MADPRQADIARAAMVTWLSFGTELDAPPSEIEALAVIERPTVDGPADLFVFRFRIDEPHWAADRGWMVGVAGPYLRVNQPTATGLGSPFSRLTREDAMTLEQHVDQLVGDLRAWHSAADRTDA